jgi:regulator of telomere elongation helicase 1
MIFTEPKDRESLAKVMSSYSAALTAERSRGAVLLEVLRGKISEGMDFADDHCRAVVVKGLPYPPINHPHVTLEKEYVKKMKKKQTPRVGQGGSGICRRLCGR